MSLLFLDCGKPPILIWLSPVDTLVGYEREEECHAWRWSHNVPHLPWFAVDDRSWLYRPFCPSLFLVDGSAGLNPELGAQLVARLGKPSKESSLHRKNGP